MKDPTERPERPENAPSVFRIYKPHHCDHDGYPFAWHNLGAGRGIKHLVREQAGDRCIRCHHPYPPGSGEWSACDERCTHGGVVRALDTGSMWQLGNLTPEQALPCEAQWRILTVHHLRLGDDAKRDLRWWNLAALCQRCHLQIQGKVLMQRIWPWPHSDWFKPYAAGWYAWTYLRENLTRDQVQARMDELLALELAA